jgi:glycine/D-amino acid oxidase-like deaminating enzyme
MVQDNIEILIIGGGIAGLATACHLVLAGQGGVALVEREQLPGFYASGHNAGIARQLTGRPEHTALTVQGRGLLAQEGLMTPSGGCLLAAEPGGTGTLETEAREFGLAARTGTGSPVAGLRATEWLRVEGDGVIDIHAELGRCAGIAEDGGASLRFGCRVLGIEPDGAGFRVDTDQGRVRTRILVNAAGAWAGEVGRMAGGLDLLLRPLRRHLAWTGAPWPGDWPWAWWTDRPFYLRPESGGALLCPCDEGEVPLPERGLQPASDGKVLAGLDRSARDLAPDLGGVAQARLWCGLRTFAPDRRFVLGPDPVNPGLHWVAGLGGHGMTAGLAVGRLAAGSILGRISPGALDPGRFLPHS